MVWYMGWVVPDVISYCITKYDRGQPGTREAKARGIWDARTWGGIEMDLGKL